MGKHSQHISWRVNLAGAWSVLPPPHPSRSVSIVEDLHRSIHGDLPWDRWLHWTSPKCLGLLNRGLLNPNTTLWHLKNTYAVNYIYILIAVDNMIWHWVWFTNINLTVGSLNYLYLYLIVVGQKTNHLECQGACAVVLLFEISGHISGKTFVLDTWGMEPVCRRGLPDYHIYAHLPSRCSLEKKQLIG